MRNKAVLVGASAAVTASFTVAGPLPQAQAVAVPVKPQPIAVVVSAPTTEISMVVDSTARRHVVTLTAPRIGVVAYGGSRLSRLTIHGVVPSVRLRPGCQSWYLKDGDGTQRRVAVCVLDRSILALTRVTGLRHRYVVTGVAVRFDGRRYVPLTNAVVHVQEKRHGSWATVGSLKTDGRGAVRGTFGHAPGPVTVRLSMPSGDTIAGASSSEATELVH